ncbi:hypothetical protein IFO70_08695 [Phormidium tenue FACHB-886]|nr:hypothetical protein [Phormidium tenue FACHB-886]
MFTYQAILNYLRDELFSEGCTPRSPQKTAAFYASTKRYGSCVVGAVTHPMGLGFFHALHKTIFVLIQG